MSENKTVTSRRGMLKGAAVAAGAMSVPMIATAQTTSLRFQSTWPSKDIFHEYASDFAKKVNENIMSVSEAVDKGYKMLFDRDGVKMYHTSDLELRCPAEIAL